VANHPQANGDVVGTTASVDTSRKKGHTVTMETIMYAHELRIYNLCYLRGDFLQSCVFFSKSAQNLATR
jgi:hypothetical protein